MRLKTQKEIIFFYNIPIILFSLIPLFLITGPFLSDLAVSLISVIFLIYCIKENNFIFFKNKYFYFFLIFWLYLILNSLFNNLNFDSLKISIFYFRYAVFVVAILSLIKFDDKFLKYFYYSILFCFIILIFDGFYQYFNGENIIGFKSPNSYRVSSFFHNDMVLGSYLSRLWPIFFGLSLIYLKKQNKFYMLVIFILSEVLIFLSGDRTAFFFLNLSGIFVIIFSERLLRLRFYILISSIFLIIVISYFNPIAKQRFIDQTLAQMNLVNLKKSDEKINIFSEQHNQHYVAAYKIFIDNKTFGVGVKNFRNFCNEEKYKTEFSCSTHPHNYYLQILSEIGILGFGFLIIVLFFFCKYLTKHLIFKFNKKYYFSDFEICILSGILIYLWPLAPTGNVFNNWLNIILILNIPLLISSRNLSK